MRRTLVATPGKTENEVTVDEPNSVNYMKYFESGECNKSLLFIKYWLHSYSPRLVLVNSSQNFERFTLLSRSDASEMESMVSFVQKFIPADEKSWWISSAMDR